MTFSFGQGILSGAQMARTAQEEKNSAMEAELRGKDLQLRAGALALNEREQANKITENGFLSVMQMAEALGEQVKMMPNIKPGSRVDQTIDQLKSQIAGWAEKTNRDPQMAQIITQTIRESAGLGIKPITASPGSSILKQNESGGFDTLHTQPTAPPQEPERLRLLKGANAVFKSKYGRDMTEEESLRVVGAAPHAESQSRFSPAGPYVDENGQHIGDAVFDRSTGRAMLQVPGNPEPQPIPTGARPLTETALSRNALTGEQFMKLADEVRETEQSVTAVSRYFKNVKDSEQGWKLLADQFVGQMKSIFGGDLTQSQFNTLKQTGQLNALLGRFRKDVVGGGVMTEQDALRVMSALGGDINSMRNPEVVASLLKDVVQGKVKDYEERLRPAYNEQVRTTPRGKGFKEKDPLDIDFDAVFTTRKQEAAKSGPVTAETIKQFSDDEILKRLGIRK